ncbi:MAG TPA: DUF962 domain-containing protein [Bacteroidia bacterium]|jgi:hypothetical protein|nr:DUF962 domain-containing protein [Bacteroidia bacterium]
MADKEYKTFEEFYPYYLNEHRQVGTRVTHFIGTSLFFSLTITAIIKGNAQFLLASVISAYFFAWIGHFFIEKNKPATFKYPWMSLKGDFKLYFEILLGKQKFKGN